MDFRQTTKTHGKDVMSHSNNNKLLCHLNVIIKNMNGYFMTYNESTTNLGSNSLTSGLLSSFHIMKDLRIKLLLIQVLKLQMAYRIKELYREKQRKMLLYLDGLSLRNN